MNLRLLWTLMIVAILSTFLAAQQAVVYAPNGDPPKRVDLPHVVEVPMVAAALPGANLPVIEVMVNGKGPFRFGIETGAGFVGVSRAFVDAAALTRSGGPDEFPEFHVDAVAIGGAVFHDLTVTVMPRGASGVDGILGLPFFHDVLLTLDYPAHRVRLSDEKLAAPNSKDILSIQHSGPFWAIPVAIGGHKFSAVIDTRSTTAISVSPEVAAQLLFEGELQVIGRSGGAGIPTTEVKAGKLNGDVILGAYTIAHPTLTVHALPPGFPTEPLIGSGVLQNFIVSLDQRGERMRLNHEGTPTITLPEPRPRPTAPPAAPASGNDLASCAGKYGDRNITYESGALYLQRPGGGKFEMVMTERDKFGLREVSQAKIEFQRDASGAVSSVRVLNREGQWETAARTASQ